MPSASLLATKLYRPLGRPSLVPRPRLTARLMDGLSRPLTLISAPAGFGKTTLISEWLEAAAHQNGDRAAEEPLQAAWLSLDEADNDPARFWEYVIAALDSLYPSVGVNVLAWLYLPQPPPIESILTGLINAFIALATAQRPPAASVLVLDDYHVISAPAIHAGLNFLLDHLPPQLHIVVTTRVDPPLPLARWRARDQLTELRAADLRFTSAEAAAFLTAITGLSLSAEDIAALGARTEGWIAGLQLAALSMQGRDGAQAAGFIAAFTGSHRYVLEYLSEEVLRRQPVSLQAFLAHTSILERLSGPLCNAVTGRADGQATLAQLEHANLFLIALDDAGEWFRYHHLFSEVLRHRLRQISADLIPDLHRRASEWYERQGLVADAVQHALAAEDFERAARLIEQVGMAMVPRGQLQTVLGWLKALPEAFMRDRPQLCIMHGMALLLTHELEAAEARLQDAERRVQADTPPSEARLIRGQAASLRAIIVRLPGDLAGCIALAHQGLELAPEMEIGLLVGARLNVSRTYLLTGEVTPEAERLAEAVARQARETGNQFASVNSLVNVARLQALQGRLRQAAATYAQVAQVSPAGAAGLQGLFNGAAYYVGLGDLLREWNDLEAAERHLVQGMELAQGALSVDADVVTFGYVALARLHQARRDRAAALAVLDEFARLARQRRYVPAMAARGAATRAQVWLALGEGDLTAPMSWASASGLRAEDEIAYPMEKEYLTLARVLIAQGSLQPASQLLARWLQAAEAGERFGSVIEILTLQALALQAEGNLAGASAALERALSLAQPEGYVRIFIDEGPAMQALLRTVRPRSAQLKDYVHILLAAFGAAERPQPEARPAAPSLIDQISPRELDVLRLAAEGLSNQEIADRLVIALGTAKRHMNNIYVKLDVNNRVQAVERGRLLGLL